MRIAEMFHSIQGEGEHAGTPSVFVRTTGCNLRCWFCDTPYTSWKPEGAQRRWQDVLDDVLRHNCEHVVLTGGEPLLQPEIVPLTHALADARRFVTIETAGTVYRPVHADLMSISPKRPNSAPRGDRWETRHESLRENNALVRRLLAEYACQLKYVVDRPEDLDDVDRHVRSLPGLDPSRVFLMPQGIELAELREKLSWIGPAAEERGYRTSPRLHIELFGNVRGT